MVRLLPQKEDGTWTSEFDNTTLNISSLKGRYRAEIITTTHIGGFGFSTRRKHLSDLITQINLYLQKLNGDRIILIVSKSEQDLYQSTLG